MEIEAIGFSMQRENLVDTDLRRFYLPRRNSARGQTGNESRDAAKEYYFLIFIKLASVEGIGESLFVS